MSISFYHQKPSFQRRKKSCQKIKKKQEISLVTWYHKVNTFFILT
ncbi:hypothetical protein KP77_23510 [Jeotgalibacillus alimentarius]|uniref:Uncharacterized protein n=1 Tax=Jeotgalibacillus alimentarius TaxID=135826 RepID=A0A0C2S2Q9_9BACL|nr:hypothetical protein KP77_23510 [Jeotgalibacillus alimentarius]